MPRTGRPPSLTPEQDAEVERLYLEEEWFLREIKEELGLKSLEPVKSALARRGVKPRQKGFQKGARHVRWKNHRYVNKLGYVVLKIRDDDPRRNLVPSERGVIFEHRLVMAEHLGRQLTKDESVHHIDGNRQNNCFANLELRRKAHGPGQKLRCADCGGDDIITVPLFPEDW